MTDRKHHIKSIPKTFKILQELEREGAAGVSELARQTDIPKSSVYKYLATLRSLGFITKEGQQYALSFRLFQLGRHVREQCEIYRDARPKLDRLAAEIGETVSLVVEEDGDAVYLYQTRAEAVPLAPVEAGGRLPIHVPAGGKAILSYRPAADVEAYLADAGISPSASGLLDELDRIRDQRLIIDRDSPGMGGYSAGRLQGHRHVVGHDQSDGLHSVAVPIRDGDDCAVAAIEVSGPASALPGRRLEEDIATLLVETGKAIETKLLD